MTKILALAFFFTFLSIYKIKAQEPSTISDKIIDEKETYLPNLFVRINPLWTEWVAENRVLFTRFPINPDAFIRLSGGASADAMLFVRKWMTLRGSVSSAYGWQMDGYSSPYHPRQAGGRTVEEYDFTTNSFYYFEPVTLNKPVTYLIAEFGTGIHLKDTLFLKKSKVYQGEGNSADYDYQKSLALNKKLIRRIIELRAGAYYYHHSINDWADGSIPNNMVLGHNGVISTDGVLWGGAWNSITYPYYKAPGVTNMYVPCGYLGLGFIRQMDRTNKADCDTYKIKGKRNLLNLFADLIIGSPIIADYKGTDGVKHDVSGNGAIGYERNYIGYRAGLEFSTGKRRAFNVKFMYIKKPGLKLFAKENSIFELSFGVCFNRLVMKHALRKKFGA